MQIPYKTTLIWSSALICLLLAGCSFVWPGSDASSAHFWSTSAATGSPPNGQQEKWKRDVTMGGEVWIAQKKCILIFSILP